MAKWEIQAALIGTNRTVMKMLLILGCRFHFAKRSRIPAAIQNFKITIEQGLSTIELIFESQ